ncbi:tetratricopeptide repeat protein [Helicobacter marmotae]|uniref:Beta-lactamase n=1 Tax=Helicobacter marmotae TaxID=152490 RepID=A0A3D8I3P2_9HELI|nr:tetratricopeptide repeat protein [Helicobacter marmotae]RDU59748.1 sel1 repeat family protein [Helicobacter marmotae]
MKRLFLVFCMLIGWADEPNVQNSSLLASIRGADSEFYQGVVMWVKNSDEASKFLESACQKRHPGACLYLGNYYEIKSQDKRDSQANLLKSQQYYQKGYENSLEACKDGGVEWCTIQAVALIDGRGVAKDIAKGMEYLHIMCDHNMENACFMLGSYYFYGTNVEKDLQKAEEFNHKALELDSKACDERKMYACILSAEIYQQGLSVDMDLPKAKDFYHRACKLGNQFACDYVQKLK